jgi:hypothetical protein
MKQIWIRCYKKNYITYDVVFSMVQIYFHILEREREREKSGPLKKLLHICCRWNFAVEKTITHAVVFYST